MVQLFTKNCIQENLSSLDDWKQKAYLEFEKRMTNTVDKFPCIPATQGFALNHLRYGFIEDPRKESSSTTLTKLLKHYGEISRDTGNYASLIALFDTPPDIVERYDIEQFEYLFWSLLKSVNEQDEKDWPNHIPTDPDTNTWEFCFDGEQYFVYCATPKHKNKKSRYFPFFMLAITPRWVLEEFNSHVQASNLIKKAIRERLHQYDTTEIHPDLKWYGSEGNYEWKQYFLRDDNTSPSVCPFHQHWTTDKKEKL